MEAELAAKCKEIRLLALDVDGVLTDGAIIIGQEGELCKRFNAKDGLGIAIALRSGLEIAIITGRRSEIVRRRARELGIELVLEGIADKRLALGELAARRKLTSDQLAFMGDDLNDLPAFAAAGLSFAPADAAAAVIKRAQYVTCADGGRGAVREVIELLLMQQGRWQEVLSGYLQTGWGDSQ